MKIPYIGARVDFLISKENDEHKWKLCAKLEDFSRFLFYTGSKKIIKEIYHKGFSNLTYDEQKDIIREGYKKHPNRSLIYIAERDTIRFLDQTPAYVDHYNQIKENFMIIEVKASVGKYPRKKGKNTFSKAQRKHIYYDSLLRVKIEPNFEGGFTGTIHPKDIENFLTHPKNAK